ncbi:MAG: alcohol dehydrogenase catalytic domain-containing protein [Euryarchaeota archaeon]|nr:alcohol dehydrogenase catalytic domain-containing protein [Euryarchaeota archaeon]MDE1835783.1 alcohol dehydrogenase catalytic domain-containing protein [Euryarchaeota archaeon]MDE1880743.1 alcohol dehydrogenase catalytic domain-containing protein [Euryarchaeota archaeon]MDE2043974.1 alcohol dehydrogenase catalytic domain-containing protein [Thermoplasmata archaeon]
MKAALLGPHGVGLHEAPAPHAREGELIVAMRACGVCGTDLEKVRGNYSATGKIGHEPAGEVVEVGPGVDGFSIGDRVFVHHHVACGRCAVCAAGTPTFCPQYQATNIDPGGFSELFRVPALNVKAGAALPLPPSLSDLEATFIEPLGCCIEGLWSTPFREGQKVVVLGLGPIGLLYLRLLKALGAAWIGAGDLSPYRRAAAERSGADVAFDPREGGVVQRECGAATGGLGPDLVVVATGAPSAIAQAVGLCRRGGTVNLFGLPEKGGRLDYDLQQLYLRGVRVIPTYATTERGTMEALKQISIGRVKVRDLATHTFPLSEVPAAFAQAARTEEAIKVVVTSDGRA